MKQFFRGYSIYCQVSFVEDIFQDVRNGMIAAAPTIDKLLTTIPPQLLQCLTPCSVHKRQYTRERAVAIYDNLQQHAPTNNRHNNWKQASVTRKLEPISTR